MNQRPKVNTAHLLFTVCILFYAGNASAEPEKPHKCKTHYCSEYEWENGLERFDPLTIKWPLHYTGQTLKDKLDGGSEYIDVYFEDHDGKKRRKSLGQFRNSPYCPDLHFLKDGIDMDDAFECTENPTTKPRWTYTDCSLILSSFEDRRIYAGELNCYKVLREWIILDWCTYEPNSHGSSHQVEQFNLVKDLCTHTSYFAYSDSPNNVPVDGYYTYTQVIKVEAESELNMLSCEDLVIDIGNRCEDEISISNRIDVSGACPAQKITVDLSVFDSEGQLVSLKKINSPANKDFDMFIGNLSIGEYILKWRMKDACGNRKSCEQALTIGGDPIPFLTCVRDVSTSIKDSTGVTLWAKDFVISASGVCGNEELTFSFDEEASTSSLTINCDEYHDLNELFVYVTDEGGYQTFCRVNVYISQSSVCPEGQTIVGQVFNRDLESIDHVDVAVSVFDQVIGMGEVGFDGYFEVRNISQEAGAPHLIPISKEDPFQGLDAMDLVILLKHISRVEIIEDAIDLIAADINDDGRVDFQDYWALAGYLYNLPGKAISFDPWKFVDRNLIESGQEAFDELSNPIIVEDQRASYELIAVKMGDLYRDLLTTDIPQGQSRSIARLVDKQIKHISTRLNNGLPNDVLAIELDLDTKVLAEHTGCISNDQSTWIACRDNEGWMALLLADIDIFTKLNIEETIHTTIENKTEAKESKIYINQQGEVLVNTLQPNDDSRSTHFMDADFIISPNPFSDQNQTRILGNQLVGLPYHITDHMGIIQSHGVVGQHGFISFNGPPGIYFITLTSEKTQLTKKVLKIR